MYSVKYVLLNFLKNSQENMCRSFFFNKVAGLRPATLLKKRLWFPVNFVKFLRTPFLQNTSGRMLLHFFSWLLIVKASLKVWKVFIKQYHPWDRRFYEKIHIHIQQSLHKKWCFPLRISAINVTKSAVSCGFGHIYWRNP